MTTPPWVAPPKPKAHRKTKWWVLLSAQIVLPFLAGATAQPTFLWLMLLFNIAFAIVQLCARHDA